MAKIPGSGSESGSISQRLRIRTKMSWIRNTGAMLRLCTRTGTDSNEIGLKTNNDEARKKMLCKKHKARAIEGKRKTKAGSFVDPVPELWINPCILKFK
jgi:hypothetical protein